jgi:hypothetical protein
LLVRGLLPATTRRTGEEEERKEEYLGKNGGRMEEGKGETEERQTGSSQAFKSCLLDGGVIISSSLSVIFRMNLKETFVIYKPAERRQI